MVSAPINSKKEEIEVAVAEAPKFREVTWYKDPGLRKLYVSFSL